MRLKYNVDTQIIFQIGDPMDRSCSPFMMNALYDYAHVNAVCLPVTIPKGGLPEFIQAARTLHAAGFGLTMPHKSDIIPLLDVCDEASRLFNSVNTVRFQDDRLIGIGFDGLGMGMAIESQTGPVAGKRVLLIGAGSVSGPIGAALCQKGAIQVHVVNRTVDKACNVAETLSNLYGIQTSYGLLSDDELCAVAPDVDLAVQCTSLGMSAASGDFESLRFVDQLPDDCVVADVLYPVTTLLNAAKSRGLRTVNGKGMMLEQQLATMDFRFGIRLDRQALLEAEEALDIAIAMRDLRAQRISSILSH